VIERSDIIESELRKQASGAIADDQLTAFGRQAGAQYICISDIIFLRNRSEVVYAYDKNGNRYVDHYNHYKDHQVSVRMIDVETAEVLAFSLSTVSITDAREMMMAITTAVHQMLSTVQPTKPANMPKIAVYVTGGRTGQREGNALYSYTLEALFTRARNLGTFKVIERADAFTRQIDREQKTQRSGHVDDSQIARLGKQYGIERILIASMERAMNEYSVSARMVNIETARVERASSLATTNSDLDGLEQFTVGMVEEMFGLTAEERNKRAIEAAAAAEAARRAKIRSTTLYIVGGAALLGLIIWANASDKKNNETTSVKDK